MAQQDFDAFIAELRKFGGLWQSGTVACVGVDDRGSYFNLATRIVLDPAVCPGPRVLKKVDLTDFVPPFFGALIEFPIAEINQLIYQVVVNGSLRLKFDSVVAPVHLIPGATRQTQVNPPDPHWLPSGPRSRSQATTDWGIERPLRVLIVGTHLET